MTEPDRPWWDCEVCGRDTRECWCRRCHTCEDVDYEHEGFDDPWPEDDGD